MCLRISALFLIACMRLGVGVDMYMYVCMCAFVMIFNKIMFAYMFLLEHKSTENIYFVGTEWISTHIRINICAAFASTFIYIRLERKSSRFLINPF